MDKCLCEEWELGKIIKPECYHYLGLIKRAKGETKRLMIRTRKKALNKLS